jgi:hypothetical protein
MKEIVQFVRNRHGQPKGVLVARQNGIGWSAVNPRDTFNKELALEIARGRADKGSTIATRPSHVEAALPNFRNRAARYFRRSF